jgi:hypothetical protein
MIIAEYILNAYLVMTIASFIIYWVSPNLSTVIGTICIILFFAYNISMPSSMNIRVDLFLTIPLLLITLIILILSKKEKSKRDK